MIQIDEIKTELEKDMIMAMILDNGFLKNIIPILKIDLLEISFLKLVAKWCINFYNKYEKAPKNEITIMFEEYKQQSRDESKAETIEIFLNNLSSQHQDGKYAGNSLYLLDRVEKYFKIKSLEQLKNNITGAILEDDILKAESYISNYTRISRPVSDGIDILKDTSQAISILYETEDKLFKLPGQLGKKIKYFCRDDLVACVAPAKRGKTWWLIEMATRALYAKRKVLFVSLEMTTSQMISRVYQNLLGECKVLPEERTEKESEIEVPCFIKDNFVGQKEKNKKGLTPKKISRKTKSLKRMLKNGQFILTSFPANSAGVQDIKNYLDNLNHFDKFTPDVIVVDYADILKAEKISKDERHQIDSTWRGLRQLAQERHCLVVTASHSNKGTFDKDITAKDITEDIRKFNHVACLFAINQSKKDRENNFVRISLLGHRHEGNAGGDVFVLQKLEIGKPYLDSRDEQYIPEMYKANKTGAKE